LLLEPHLDLGNQLRTFSSQKKAQVFALDFNDTLLQEKFKNHPSINTDNLILIRCDVTKQDDVDNAEKIISKKIQEKTKNKYIYGLINNAGISNQSTTLVDTHPDDLFRVINVNTLSLHRMTRTFFPHFLHNYNVKEKTTSSDDSKALTCVINMGSIAGFVASPFMGAYCMSKFAVEAFSDVLRREFIPLGMHVSCIEPFFANTGIIAGIEKYKEIKHSLPVWEELLEKRVEKFKSNLILMSPDEVAKIVVDILEVNVRRRPIRVMITTKHWTYTVGLTLAKIIPSSIQDLLIKLELKSLKK